MKLTKDFRGVKNGEIYPTQFLAGDECPEELIEGAHSLGALDPKAGEAAVKDIADKRAKAARDARAAAAAETEAETEGNEQEEVAE